MPTTGSTKSGRSKPSQGMKSLLNALCAAFRPSPTNTGITVSARPTFVHVAAQLFSSAGAVRRLAAQDPDPLRSRCGRRSAQSRPQRLSLPRCHSYQPFRCPPGLAQNHHHSAAAAGASTATIRAATRGKRRVPMDSGHRVEADREKISSSSSALARMLGRTAGGYEGGAGRRRRVVGLVTCAPRAAPPTPSACEY